MSAAQVPKTEYRKTGYRRRPAFFAAVLRTFLRAATFDLGAAFSFFCAPALLWAAFFAAVRDVGRPPSALLAWRVAVVAVRRTAFTVRLATRVADRAAPPVRVAPADLPVAVRAAVGFAGAGAFGRAGGIA